MKHYLEEIIQTPLLGHDQYCNDTHTHTYIYIYIYIYTECPRRNVQDFGRVFLMLKYTNITQKTYIQS